MTDSHSMPTHLPSGISLSWLMHSTHALLALAAAAIIILGLGIATGIIIATARRRNDQDQNTIAATPATAGTANKPLDARSDSEQPARQRGALVSGMLTIRRLADDPQVVDIVDDSLRAAAVTVFDPTGHTKDPRYHRIDHTVPAATSDQDGTIAHTLAPGYIDAGRVVQPADVVVYRWEGPQ